MSEIFLVETDEDIAACYDAFKALRPHLENKSTFVEQVKRQRNQSYQIAAVKFDGIVPCAAGFRFAEFLAWGKVLYVDDLTTLPDYRGHGYAGQLMDWLLDHARAANCRGLHLDTGYARHDAHRLYLKKGLKLNCHHLAIEFP